MKTILTSTLSFFCLALMAQPTITSEWLPTVGDVIWTLVVDSDTLIDQGPSGANIAWDFSKLNIDDPDAIARYEIVDPSETPYAAEFPDAEVAAYQSDFELYGYFSTDNNCLAELGSNFAGFSQQEYTTPQKILPIPFTYLDTASDSFAGTTTQTLLTTYHWGNITIEADGYGSILLPGATEPVENVLRIKTIETGSDSSNLGSGIREKILYESTTYSWISDKYPLALASTSMERSTQIGYADGIPNDTLEQQPYYAFAFDRTVVLANTAVLKPNEINFAISPNPVTDILNLEVNFKKPETIALSIYDLQGKRVSVQRENGVAGQNKLTVNTDGLHAGMYILRLSGSDFESSLKFIKE